QRLVKTAKLFSPIAEQSIKRAHHLVRGSVDDRNASMAFCPENAEVIQWITGAGHALQKRTGPHGRGPAADVLLLTYC
ncbi:MAG: hypothetical protein ACQKBW_12895, partial [Puniceicoccales bacterium]